MQAADFSREELALTAVLCDAAGMRGCTSSLVFIVFAAITLRAEDQNPLTMADVLAASKPADWRAPDPENTLYLELTNGRVIIELAPAFASNHVANVKALAREHYFDGLAIIRCQDNYVTQWGDPEADSPDKKRKVQK